MKNINVIDLDGTLIEFDSMKLYIKKFLFTKFFFQLIYFSVLRKIRFIDRATFFFKIVAICRKHKNYELIMKEISFEVISNLKEDILKEIDIQTENNCTNVLCSASPVDYVLYVAKHLNWDYVTSELDSEKMIHMYGENKLVYIHKMYPKSEYNYNFAVADSKSDLILLKEFKTYKLLI